MVIVVCLLGLILGSFLAAYSWRLPRKVPISTGRSFCPKCREKIKWYDNIPVISFFLLGQKCRNCKYPISVRYPLIELATAILFTASYVFFDNLVKNISWLNSLPQGVALAYLFFLTFVFLAIFVIDLEEMIIPDELVFVGILGTLTLLLFANGPTLLNLFSGFFFALLFLLLNFLTRGRGMGLGDVKFVILLGTITGPIVGVVALLVSFVIGALVGVILILLGKAKLQQKIAFGPFLVIGFWVSIIFAHEILRLY